MALGVTDHIWDIGELVDAALSPEAPHPEGRQVGQADPGFTHGKCGNRRPRCSEESGRGGIGATWGEERRAGPGEETDPKAEVRDCAQSRSGEMEKQARAVKSRVLAE